MQRLAQQMREAISKPEERALYRRRKLTVEPVFGQIKQQRGMRRFLFVPHGGLTTEWC